jgi:sucrose-6-phosphate hydrolase SacC (GH32 family)
LTHGNMSWGHATSTDLITWHPHRVALIHDETDDIFSGSIVWDEENTSGLAPEGGAPLVAIYTAAHRNGQHQRQALAVSLDGGFTWSPYAGNPVLDLGTDDFRDPKVFRFESGGDGWWVMVAVEARSRRVALFRSDDLIRWRFLSTFGPAGSAEGLWECPDLFPLAVNGDPEHIQWVLVVSVTAGAPAGGGGTQYFVGEFDGTVFTPIELDPEQAGHDSPVWLDWGRDCYAGVTFSGLPLDHRILMAWMSNWDYAQDVPSAPWRGTMTIPRLLTLLATSAGPRLAQRPVLPEAPGAGSEETSLASGSMTSDLPVCALIRLRVDLTAGDLTHLTIQSAEGSVIRITHRASIGQLRVERTEVGAFHPAFPSDVVVPLSGEGRWLELELLIDTTSLELFAEHGQVVVTHQVVMQQPWRLGVVTGDVRVVITELTPEQRR